MILVIAGSYKEYKYYLNENKLSLKDAMYIHTKEQCFGRRGTTVVRYGNFWRNPCNDIIDFYS